MILLLARNNCTLLLLDPARHRLPQWPPSSSPEELWVRTLFPVLPLPIQGCTVLYPMPVATLSTALPDPEVPTSHIAEACND